MLTKNLLEIAICDDEEIFRQQVGMMTEKILEEQSIACHLTYCKDGLDLYDKIKNGQQFQVILLDIVMEKLDGMQLASLIREEKNTVSIVFISSDREMVFQGYEVGAVRYLAKPLKEEKLKEALMYCCDQTKEKAEIILPTVFGHHKIPYPDIEYIEAFERGCRFFLEDEKIDVKIKFSEAQNLLPKSSFVQSHRAYIVNLAHVRRIRPNEFEMKSGSKIPISKYRYGEVSKKFLNYIK